MTQALIPAISIESLLAAREAAHEAVRTCRRVLVEAQARLDAFGVDLPEVQVPFPDGNPADICDTQYATAIEDEIDRKVWGRLFTLTNIDTLMDHKTRAELFERLGRVRTRFHRRNTESLPALTRENIEATFSAIHAQQGEFFERCVEQVYRGLSWEHATNEPSRIGEKLILYHQFYTWSRALMGDSVHLNVHEHLHDLERVLCILDGQAPATHATGLRSLGQIPFGSWIDVPSPSGGAPLMRLKVFRKGTTHVRILNQAHVDAMNRIMARRFPGAIPPPQEAAAEQQASEPQRPTVALAKTEKAARQAFYTPAEIADELVKAAGIGWSTRVLEPSAGEGAIVRAILRVRNEHVTAVENDPHGIEMLGQLAARVNRDDVENPRVTVVPRDFFDVPVKATFDAVVMNPPFANAQEVEHVLRAWQFVKPGGVLVSVMSNSAKHRKDGRYGVLAKFLAENGAEISSLPDGAFEASGTRVSTVMVVVRKR